MQLKSLAVGRFGNELEETIMDLENQLQHLNWPRKT
jgi:hypothetical protein